MSGQGRIRIIVYNPFVSDLKWVVGSFRTEETSRALSDSGVEGIIASPFLRHRRAISEGIDAVPLPSKPLQTLKSFLELVRKGNFDLIQERPYSRGFVRSGCGLAASLDSGLPYVTELHNIGTPASYIRRLPVHLVGLWHSDLVLSYSHDGGRNILCTDRSKVVTVPNGYSGQLVELVKDPHAEHFDLDRFANGRIVFGFFGTITEAKGVGIILNVARRMRDRRDICFAFAGSGHLASEVQRLSESSDSNVVYLGVLGRKDTLSCMSQCRANIALYDSQQSAAGNPVKVVESIALGVPVVVNSELRMPDRLRQHCVVLDRRDTDSLSGIVKSLADAALRPAVPDFIEEYSIESISKRIIIPAYRRLLG